MFVPILGDYYKGMASTIMLHNSRLPGQPTAQDIHAALTKYYEGQKLVRTAPFGGEEPVIYSSGMAGHDSLQLIVCGHEEQTIVTALFVIPMTKPETPREKIFFTRAAPSRIALSRSLIPVRFPKRKASVHAAAAA